MITPSESETAKPLTGPVPNIKRTNAVISVVTWESKIDEKALSYPASIARRTGFPALSSSRIRSMINTFESTDIPIVRMIPAIPGNVSVAFKAARAPTNKIIFRTMVRSASKPESR